MSLSASVYLNTVTYTVNSVYSIYLLKLSQINDPINCSFNFNFTLYFYFTTPHPQILLACCLLTFWLYLQYGCSCLFFQFVPVDELTSATAAWKLTCIGQSAEDTHNRAITVTLSRRKHWAMLIFAFVWPKIYTFRLITLHGQRSV